MLFKATNILTYDGLREKHCTDGIIVGKKFWQIFRNGMDNESEDSITI